MRMEKKLSSGKLWPSTQIHAVNGVERIRPTGPHRQVQNKAATSWPTADKPTLRPNTNGSTTFACSSSAVMKKPAVKKNGVQPGMTKLAKSGIAAANHPPRNGT